MAFDHAEFDKHEGLTFAHDAASGLNAIIAIHDTRLGPALGGTRFWNYGTSADALTDVLRLSRGMTYKNAIAGLNFGGGKAVIWGAPETAKSPALWRAYGRALNDLGGRFVTGEDVGLTVGDVDEVMKTSRFISGSSTGPAASGDPSGFTAEGVFLGLKATAKAAFGGTDVKGLRVGVLGLGAVGWKLAGKLHDAGASLVVADIDAEKAARAGELFGASVSDPAFLAAEDMDLFAPCALGGVINEAALSRLKAKAIAGAANNQLATRDMDAALAAGGVLYAPDYVINGGGVMNVAAEAEGDYDADRVWANVARIPGTLGTIFKRARATGTPTNMIADAMAQERLEGPRKAA